MIASSGVFDVEEVDFPYARCDGARNANWSTMQVNDIRIGLDTRDTLSPTAHFHGIGHFKDDGLEIVSKEDIYDLKLLKATKDEATIAFDEYLKNEN